MAKPTIEESVALSRSEALLRFAAENVPTLDNTVSLAIAQATESQETDSWSPEMSQMFWAAYNRLSEAVKPVTPETLNAVTPVERQRPSWMRFLGTEESSLATRTSGRFLAVLVMLLLVTVPIQLYAWTLTNLQKDMDSANALLVTSADKFAARYGDLSKTLAGKDNYTAQQSSATTQLMQAIPNLRFSAQAVQSKSETLRQWRTFSWGRWLPTTASPAGPAVEWYNAAGDVLRTVGEAKNAVVREDTSATLVVGILLSFVMPILFGTIGALAYVIRTISSQITSYTFSATSPIRHWLRVALGALLGVVVGLFTDLTQQLSLQPLAIAFLAGYGVEAVFSMFDGLIERFKTAPGAASAASLASQTTRPSLPPAPAATVQLAASRQGGP